MPRKNERPATELVLDSSEPDDRYKLYRQLFYPSRLEILEMIHAYHQISAHEIEELLGLKFHAVELSLAVLEELGLISVELVPNPGHGVRRIATSLIPAKENSLNISVLLQYIGSELADDHP